MRVEKIVITGGPCTGKTTAMGRIKKEFTEQGYNVIFIPESATELMTNGVTPRSLNSIYEFQKQLLKLQIRKETRYTADVKNMSELEKVLIVCDRGVIDNKAYLKDAEFEQMLNELNLDETELRERYDAVFHLETVAKGAEEYYTLSNNVTRMETAEEAVKIDDRLICAWDEHPYFRVIDNSSDFEGKMKELISKINEFLEDSKIKKL